MGILNDFRNDIRDIELSKKYGVDPKIIEAEKAKRKQEEWEKENAGKQFLKTSTRKMIRVASIVCAVFFCGMIYINTEPLNWVQIVKNAIQVLICIGIFISLKWRTKKSEAFTLGLSASVFLIVYGSLFI